MTGSSGVGELLAQTLAARNVTVIALDVNPIQTEHCECIGSGGDSSCAHRETR